MLERLKCLLFGHGRGMSLRDMNILIRPSAADGFYHMQVCLRCNQVHFKSVPIKDTHGWQGVYSLKMGDEEVIRIGRQTIPFPNVEPALVTETKTGKLKRVVGRKAVKG